MSSRPLSNFVASPTTVRTNVGRREIPGSGMYELVVVEGKHPALSSRPHILTWAGHGLRSSGTGCCQGSCRADRAERCPASHGGSPARRATGRHLPTRSDGRGVARHEQPGHRRCDEAPGAARRPRHRRLEPAGTACPERQGNGRPVPLGGQDKPARRDRPCAALVLSTTARWVPLPVPVGGHGIGPRWGYGSRSRCRRAGW